LGGYAAGAVTDPILVGDVHLEIAWHGEARGGTTLVFLHEGLGSVATWRDFPARVAAETGMRALVYSRRGYGGSDPVPLPRPLTYMHEEAETALPLLLDALGVNDAVLLGHSDGGSIALIHAGSASREQRTRGLVLLAPHVFCEEVSVESIRRARQAFVSGNLREKLARYHGANTDNAFWGWNDAWLDPAWKEWNIEDRLARIEIPILAIQGQSDPYGTLAQLDAIERGVRGPFTRLVLPRVGHDPCRDAPEATLAAIARFIAALARLPPRAPSAR
jgi:pimeloyl-ACP methyl ester carboxylesterase